MLVFISHTRTCIVTRRVMAQAEWLDAEVDGRPLGQVEAVLQGADAALLLLQEEAPSNTNMLPVLGAEAQNSP